MDTSSSIRNWIENQTRFGGQGKTLKGGTPSRAKRKHREGEAAPARTKRRKRKYRRSRGKMTQEERDFHEGKPYPSKIATDSTDDDGVLNTLLRWTSVFGACIAGGAFVYFFVFPVLSGAISIPDSPSDAIANVTNETNVSVPDVPSPNPREQPGTEEFRRAVIREVINQTNAERQQRGLPPLRENDRLTMVARQHSLAMSDRGDIYHSRDASCGGSWGENVAKSWYREQIVGGDYYSTPEELAQGLVEQWMESPGHRENILRSQWREIGIGIAVVEEDGNDVVYATQQFCG